MRLPSTLPKLLLAACLSVVISGCGALGGREEVVITATPNAVQRAEAQAPAPALTSDTGAFESQLALLDGVCTEFLLGAAGETLVWDRPEALAAFYDRVDESEACGAPVARGTFDFAERILAGAIATATGCDAAFQVIALAHDDDARTQTLVVELRVEPGCAYELAEPLLVAVPRPLDGVTLRVEVRGP